MSHPIAYLAFDGNCAEAMRFYERALEGRIEIMMSGADSPMAAEFPEESAHRIPAIVPVQALRCARRPGLTPVFRVALRSRTIRNDVHTDPEPVSDVQRDRAALPFGLVPS